MKDLDIFMEKLGVARVEEQMPQVLDELTNLPQVEMPLTHHFADGQYVRELFMPEGTFIIGHRHRFSTVNFLLKGRMSVYQGEDEEILHLEAPTIWTSQAGVRKILYIHEDCVGANAHPSSETDLEVLRGIFTISDTKEVEQCGQQ